MESNKEFIKEQLQPYKLTKDEEKQACEQLIKKWDDRFFILVEQDNLLHFMEKGIPYSVATKIIDRLQKKEGLEPEWEALLIEKKISIEKARRQATIRSVADIHMFFYMLISETVTEIKKQKRNGMNI